MNPPSRFSSSHAAAPISYARRRSLVREFAIAAAVLASLSTQAAPPPGQLLASQCFQCHGTNGRAVGGFESINGKSADDMYKKLLEMSSRRPEGIMDVQARAYTPIQLKLIATYLASLPAQAATSVQR